MTPTGSRRWLSPVLAATLAGTTAGAGGAQILSRDSEIVFQVPAGASRQPDAATVELLENGALREVTAVEPVAERWRIVVYFDLPGSTPEGVEAATTAIGAAAEALVALGDVEIVVADLIVERTLEPTANAVDARAALAAVAAQAGGAGPLLELRRDLQAAADARSGDPDADGLRTADLLEGFLLELDTLRAQRSNLLETLEDDAWARGPPRLLLLVRDGTDLSADTFAQRLLGEPTPAFERAAVAEQRRQRSVWPGRSRLSAGASIRFTPRPTDAEGIDDLLPGRVESSEAGRSRQRRPGTGRQRRTDGGHRPAADLVAHPLPLERRLGRRRPPGQRPAGGGRRPAGRAGRAPLGHGRRADRPDRPAREPGSRSVEPGRRRRLRRRQRRLGRSQRPAAAGDPDDRRGRGGGTGHAGRPRHDRQQAAGVERRPAGNGLRPRPGRAAASCSIARAQAATSRAAPGVSAPSSTSRRPSTNSS